jgi:hypothetical protein
VLLVHLKEESIDTLVDRLRSDDLLAIIYVSHLGRHRERGNIYVY